MTATSQNLGIKANGLACWVASSRVCSLMLEFKIVWCVRATAKKGGFSLGLGDSYDSSRSIGSPANSQRLLMMRLKIST